jgi:hypothetical protein
LNIFGVWGRWEVSGWHFAAFEWLLAGCERGMGKLTIKICTFHDIVKVNVMFWEAGTEMQGARGAENQ